MRLGLDLLAQFRTQARRCLSISASWGKSSFSTKSRVVLTIIPVLRRARNPWAQSHVIGFGVAVEADGLAGDHPGGGRSQKEAQIGDLFGLDEAPDRLDRDHFPGDLVEGHAALSASRGDDAIDARRRELRRDRCSCSGHCGVRVR